MQTPWAETNMQTHTHPTSTPPPTTGNFGQTSPHHTSFDTWPGETTGYSEYEEDNIFLNLDKELRRQQAQEDSQLSTPQPLLTTQREQPVQNKNAPQQSIPATVRQQTLGCKNPLQQAKTQKTQ
jgi:hypothetical protein